jgi:hypothetical protein
MGIPVDNNTRNNRFLAPVAEKMDCSQQAKTSEYMIRSLRNTHRRAWMAIALLLPLAIIFSWLVIPNPVPVKLLAATETSLLPEIKGKKETGQYCINLRSNAEKLAWQLEWKNRLALTTPSAVIYQARKNGNNIDSAKLIGRIEARGDYVFALKPGPDSILYLLVYDFIHGKIIDSVKFKIL